MPDALRAIAAAALAVPIFASIYLAVLVRASQRWVARETLRSIGVTALAVPVFASIYLPVLVRAKQGRVGLFIAVAVVGLAGTALAGFPATTGASPPTTFESPSADTFRDITLDEDEAGVAAASVEGSTFAGSAQSTAEPAPETTPEPAPALGDEPGDEPAREANVTPTSVPSPEPPAVVRFRPVGGTEGVDPSADLSVRFSTPMDPAAATSFNANIGGTLLEGTMRWAEEATVLVLDPAVDLPYGARVVLEVTTGARSAEGLAIASPRAVSFTVEPKPTPTPAPAPSPAPPSMPRGASQPGDPPADSGWRWPLLGAITQRFGESLTRYGTHYGIDIDGSIGDPVRAARSGTVVVAGHYDECGGNEVHIEHSDGLVSWYRHLSRIDVAVGDRVDVGDLVGRVGDTGCSLGSHLHFAISRGTTFVDPLDYLPPR